MNQFNRAEATQHITTLFSNLPGRIGLAAIRKGSATKYASFTALDTALDWAEQHSRQTVGIYVRQTTVRDGLEPGKRGGEDDSITFGHLWADLDFGTDGHAAEGLPPTALDALRVLDGLPEPSLIIHSGGGWYPIWQLDQPITLTDDNRAAIKAGSVRWQAMLKAKAAALGWRYDPVSDLARVLRLAGTLNKKIPDSPRPVQIREQTGAVYGWDELMALCPEQSQPQQAPPATAPRSHEQAQHGIHPYAAKAIADELDRLHDCQRGAPMWDNTTYEVACNLIELANSPWAGYTLADAEHDLKTHAPQDSGFGRREHDTKWRSALNKAGTNTRSEPVDNRPPTFHPAPHVDTEPPPDPYDEPEPPPQTPADDNTDEIDEAAFWNARPLLQHVRTAALARIVSPWAVLGCVMMRALGNIPPDVTLPPIVGAKGSLNSIITLVGASAAGKSSADSCARELAEWPRTNRVSTDDHLHTVAIGTGEGIPKQYMDMITEKDPGNSRKTIVRWELIRDSAMFTADEVGTLLAIGSRAGATLVPKLCSAWSGGELGQANADVTRRVPLKPHDYRFVMWIGAQPLRCEGLFEYESMGLPQRLVWLPAETTDLPEILPEWPEPIILDEVRWERHHTIVVPDELRATVRAAARLRLEGQTGALDGHVLFAREKIAVALAVLDGRRDVTVEDWDLSGVVMAVSDRTRTGVQRALAADAKIKNKRRAIAEGEAQVITEEAADSRRLKRVERNVLRNITRAGADGIARHEIRKKINSRDRKYVDEVLAELEARGAIDVRITLSSSNLQSGDRFFPADSGAA